MPCCPPRAPALRARPRPAPVPGHAGGPAESRCGRWPVLPPRAVQGDPRVLPAHLPQCTAASTPRAALMSGCRGQPSFSPQNPLLVYGTPAIPRRTSPTPALSPTAHPSPLPMSRNLIALQNKFLGEGRTVYDELARIHERQGAVTDDDILQAGPGPQPASFPRAGHGQVLRRARPGPAGRALPQDLHRRSLPRRRLRRRPLPLRGSPRHRCRRGLPRGGPPRARGLSRLLRTGAQRHGRRRAPVPRRQRLPGRCTRPRPRRRGTTGPNRSTPSTRPDDGEPCVLLRHAGHEVTGLEQARAAASTLGWRRPAPP